MAGSYSTKVSILLSQAQHMNSFLLQRLLFLFLPVDGILWVALVSSSIPFFSFFCILLIQIVPLHFCFFLEKGPCGPVVKTMSSNAGGAGSMPDQGTEAPSVLVLVILSCLSLCHPVDCTHQTPLSLGISRQEYWSGLPFPSPRNPPDPGIKPRPPALQADSLPLSYQGTP